MGTAPHVSLGTLIAIAIFHSFVSSPELDGELWEAEIVSYSLLYFQPSAWHLTDTQ